MKNEENLSQVAVSIKLLGKKSSPEAMRKKQRVLETADERLNHQDEFNYRDEPLSDNFQRLLNLIVSFCKKFCTKIDNSAICFVLNDSYQSNSLLLESVVAVTVTIKMK